jgi:hypothetical protein
MKSTFITQLVAAFIFSALAVGKNLIKNPGFEEIGFMWVENSVGGGFVENNDPRFNHSGRYSGCTNTEFPTEEDAYASLWNIFNPTLVSDLNQKNNLRWWWRVSLPARNGLYSFYLKISSLEERSLYYWFTPSEGVEFPEDTLNEKFYLIFTPSDTTTEWTQTIRSFYDDWAGKGFPTSDCVAYITLFSKGQLLVEPYITFRGQFVNWDDLYLGDESYGIEEETSQVIDKIEIQNLLTRAVIKYNFPTKGKIAIYNLSGQRVKSYQLEGKGETYFQDKAGIYFTKSGNETKKIILVK